MEDTPMEDPITPLTEPTPDPIPSPPEPDPAAPPEPEPKPNGIFPATAQTDSVPPEPTAETKSVPPKPTAETKSDPPEPTAQPDSIPSEPATQTNEVDGVLPPPQPSAAPVEPPRKKRKVEEVGLEKSTYFQIRNIVKNLRPLFLQVSENPNFRKTDVPAGILKEITAVLELSKQLRTDLTTFNEPLKPSSIKDEHKENLRIPQTENATNNSTGDAIKPENDVISGDDKINELKDVPKNLEDGFKGSYVVGGSPIGWNFLVYPGTMPVYYGRTKAEKLACQIAN